MDPAELPAALTLLLLPRAGPASIARLLAAGGSPRGALALALPRLESLGLHPETARALAAARGRPTAAAVRRSDRVLASGVQTLLWSEPGYPPMLRQIQRPPPILFLQGQETALRGPQIAVVGSRSPTPAGREFAAELATGLVRYGLAITSGLARGIDTAAHWGTLGADGVALAVMGTGPDRIYPTANRALAERILESGGALVTEYPPESHPDAAHFPQRNRIISGLSLGVVVVEAGLPSGSLSTATHAAEQGREVMAVPGPVRSPTSRGCHELLRNGAALIETPEDVIRALGDRFKPAGQPSSASAKPSAPAEPSLDPVAERVFAATDTLPCSIDMLAARSGLSVAEVSSAVVRLELAGRLEAVAAGVARLR